MTAACRAHAILGGMHDVAIDILTALLLVLAAATFAAMIWAGRQVDGRTHAVPRIHLPHLHLHRRPRP